MRAALLVVLLLPCCLGSARGGEPPADPFWTADELARIDRGLEIVNLDRRDLGFAKRPIDDPFRLPVVDRALDEPLSLGGEAQAWDEVVRRGAVADVAARGIAVLGGDAEVFAVRPLERGEAELPEAIRAPLVAVLDGIRRAREAAVAARTSLGDAPDRVLKKAFRSQVEAPVVALPGDELADDAFLPAIRPFARHRLPAAGRELLRRVEGLVDALRDLETGMLLVPKEGLRISTSEGVVVVGGPGDDVHEEDDAVVLAIDVGGNDRWTRGASAYGAHPVAVCVDLAGDDVWGEGGDLSCAGALCGVAVQWDGGGHDVYRGGHASGGAAVAGAAFLVDDGGDDSYAVKDLGLGAGAFGLGVLLDRAGNDRYRADLYGEGFASTWGCGVLGDLDGHDTYDAGGVHSHAPLHRDRTQSLSQGFSIGMRPDASGGVGVLVDGKGNDRYTADIYGQGASYWYALGILVDDEGNDLYTVGHYGQGAGIHLSAGILVDRAGQDLYYAQYGVGVGGAHDYAVGILVDRGGDDHYAGTGALGGSALTNSVALLLDGGGDDGYSAVRGGGLGTATPARDTGGIALLLDAGGTDSWSERAKNDGIFVTPIVGANVDDPAPPDAGTAPDPMGASITPVAAAALVDREGRAPTNDGTPVDDLERLWKLGIRWQVGDERVIGPVARERLVALGAPTLARALERLGTKDGLEFECILAVLPKLPRAQVVKGLLGVLEAPDPATRRGALRVIATMEVAEAEPKLVTALADPETRRFALLALAALKRAPAEVVPLLRAPKEPDAVAAAVCLGTVGGDAAIAALVEALGADTPFLPRIAAGEQLARLGAAAVEALGRAAAGGATVRLRREALRVLGGTKAPSAMPHVAAALVDPDPWIRLSARVAGKRLATEVPGGATSGLAGILERTATSETDPVVRRVR